MTRFLAFQLVGPMAAWGDVAVGEVRPTRDRPGKAAIVGLLGAALGARRGDTDTLAGLDAGYGLAVRVDRPGLPFTEYQTAQRPRQPDMDKHRKRTKRTAPTRADELAAVADRSALATTQSSRAHLADGAWTVLLWPREGASGPSPDELAEALRRPRFTPYLGRKALPLAEPPAPRIVEAEGLADAVAQVEAPTITTDRGPEPVAAERPTLAWDGDAPAPWPETARTDVVHDTPVFTVPRAYRRRTEHVGG